MIGRKLTTESALLEVKYLWPFMTFLGLILVAISISTGLDMVANESPYIDAEKNMFSVFWALLTQNVGLGRRGPSGLLYLGLLIVMVPPFAAYVIKRWDLI